MTHILPFHVSGCRMHAVDDTERLIELGREEPVIYDLFIH